MVSRAVTGRWVSLAVPVMVMACGGSDSPTEPEPAAPDSVYVAAGTYELAAVTLVDESPCLDLYDRPGQGETWMGWFAAELQDDGSLDIDYRTDERCFVNGSLSYEANHAGTARGGWDLVGRDSLDVTLSNAIDGFLVPGAWFVEGAEKIGGEVDGVVRIRPDTLVFAVEPEAGGVVRLKLARGG